MSLDVKLGYRDDTIGEWTQLAHSFEQRKLNCNLNITKVPNPQTPNLLQAPLFGLCQLQVSRCAPFQTMDNEGRCYDCDLLPFMEVGSVAHKYYLLNIRLPVDERKKMNLGIGEIKDIRLVVSRRLLPSASDGSIG